MNKLWICVLKGTDLCPHFTLNNEKAELQDSINFQVLFFPCKLPLAKLMQGEFFQFLLSALPPDKKLFVKTTVMVCLLMTTQAFISEF